MKPRDPIAASTAILTTAVHTRIFPAAVAAVGCSNGPLWSEAFGTPTFNDDRTPATLDTIFDLASITKAVATTTLLLQLCAADELTLEERISASIPEWTGEDRSDTTLQDFLEHCSGLPARLIDPPAETRREFEHEVCALPLEYPLRSRSLYSDLDFILLGFIAADRGRAPLGVLFDTLWRRLLPGDGEATKEHLGFGVPAHLLARAAPTEPLPDDRRRPRRLVGEVHDHYAAALGGVAGHAGLFGTAGGVGQFARLALRGARGDQSVPVPLSAPWMALATQKSVVPGSSRALGWDTMLATSSCGTRMSPSAFGHVGFTGTSLWIDPARDRYYVLLTNRVCGGGTSEEMQRVRRAFHDALAEL